jgi:transglutaminase-like putative cysteine protease
MTGALPNAALDVRNVMWLLASMGFVVAPHVLRLPEWVGVFFCLVVGWRAWIAWRASRTPPRWLILLLAAGAVAATFMVYGRIMGRDAGTTLLVLMAAMKLLEMKTSREVVLAIHLGFVLVMTNFLFSQTIPLGIYMLACVWLFVATLVGYHRAVGRTPTLRERLVPSGMLLLQAVPLMVVFFVLFPRVQGPLWALPQDARAGLSGLSDTMTPGNISKLIQSEATAFRVEFEGDIPPYSLLYWRGPVLWSFDGRTWKAPEFTISGSLKHARAERPVRYTVTVEPHGKHWLFSLDVPGSFPRGSGVRHDLQIRSVRPVDARLRYEMTSYLDYRYGEHLPAGFRTLALSFDERRNPRTVALGRQWAREAASPTEVVNRALQFFNAQFTYTLEPPLLSSGDPYDEFLFGTKRGFCEHYAGAFALLMRAAGIPARIVTGYQGGEVNPFNRELLVRQADAHAWVEVWLEDRGWLRVDPTSVVAPNRIDSGIDAALGPIGVIPSLIAADRLGVLAGVRFAWDALNSQWNQWVLGYNVDRQRQFLASLGLEVVNWQSLALWLTVATLAVGGLVGLGLVLRDLPVRRDPAVVAWERFCAKLAAAGMARPPHEGPVDFLARVEGRFPAVAAEAREIAERYVRARYGDGLSKSEGRELLARVRRFRPPAAAKA